MILKLIKKEIKNHKIKKVLKPYFNKEISLNKVELNKLLNIYPDLFKGDNGIRLMNLAFSFNQLDVCHFLLANKVNPFSAYEFEKMKLVKKVLLISLDDSLNYLNLFVSFGYTFDSSFCDDDLIDYLLLWWNIFGVHDIQKIIFLIENGHSIREDQLNKIQLKMVLEEFYRFKNYIEKRQTLKELELI